MFRDVPVISGQIEAKSVIDDGPGLRFFGIQSVVLAVLVRTIKIA